MNKAAPPSSNLEDRRNIARAGIALGACALVSLLVGRASMPGDRDADLVQVATAALDRGQDFWRATVGPRWRDARVVVVAGPEPTPCGTAGPDRGPFYCPTNARIYLDLGFLRAVRGDLARAYVVAHEIAHHVQWVVAERDGGLPLAGVAGELEADCLAGAWIRDEASRGRVDASDVGDALQEAADVGDDRICAGCSPEEWSHGSSARRTEALRRGLDGRSCTSAGTWHP